MARPPSIPSYCLHRASGKAYVNLRGKIVYLGKYGTVESRKLYERVIGEWLQAGKPASVPTVTPRTPTITELVSRFRASGRIPASKESHYKTILSVLDGFCGPTLAKDFDGLRLMAFRAKLAERGMTRKGINSFVTMTRRIFKWAASVNIIPPDVLVKLQSVEGLKKRDGIGRESRKVRGVSDAMLEQIIEAAPPMIAAMIQIQRLTGMRAGELCVMRTSDIDTSDKKVWTYIPSQHKGTHADLDRVVMIGPRAIEVLRPWLSSDIHAFIFNPSIAEQQRRDALASKRKTPIGYGNRAGTNRKDAPKKTPGVRYTTMSYRQAMASACDKAFPLPARLARRDGETVVAYKKRIAQDALRDAIRAHRVSNRISPHQLRHAAGKAIRDQFGLDAAQVTLGHRHAKTTEIYADLNLDKAKQVAKKIG